MGDVQAKPTIRLAEIAHARSGDKGSHANIAVLAYTEAGFDWVRRHLTARAVADFLRPRLPSPRDAARPDPAYAAPVDDDGVTSASFVPGTGEPSPARVERFEVPNLRALNFLLHEILGGGASLSPDVDNQGKVLGLALLEMQLPRPDRLEEMQRRPRVEVTR